MGKVNPIVGVYIPIIRIPIEGGMTIPNIATFDHGSFDDLIFDSKNFRLRSQTWGLNMVEQTPGRFLSFSSASSQSLEYLSEAN